MTTPVPRTYRSCNTEHFFWGHIFSGVLVMCVYVRVFSLKAGFPALTMRAVPSFAKVIIVSICIVCLCQPLVEIILGQSSGNKCPWHQRPSTVAWWPHVYCVWNCRTDQHDNTILKIIIIIIYTFTIRREVIIHSTSHY